MPGRRATLQFGGNRFVAEMGGLNVSLGAWNFDDGNCFGLLGPGADEVAGEMGRVDVRGVSAGPWQIAGDLPAAVRHIGETWTASAAGNRLAECALCDGARSGSGICRDFSRILFWANCGGTA